MQVSDIAPMGEGVHIIVTMCDVGGGGERYCGVTHITFTARPSQGVRDNSSLAGDTAMESDFCHQ